MWKKFKYSGRERVAWVPPVGPAYQVLDAGKPEQGFRSFKVDQMKDIEPAVGFFTIPEDVIIKYPEIIRG